MTNCLNQHCHSVEERVVESYNADILGAPFRVKLFNSVKEEYCLNCGSKVGTYIPDLDSLLSLVAAIRATIPQKLSGKEIKFLRNAICMKSKEVAFDLDMSPEHFSRVEKGSKVLSSSAEKMFRVMVIVKLFQEKHLEHELLAKLSNAIDMKIESSWSSDVDLEIALSHVEEEINAVESTSGRWYEPDHHIAA